MPFCGECGYKMDDNAKFCLRCGAKVIKIDEHASQSRAEKKARNKASKKEQEGYCPSCGDKVIPGKRFCASCGWSFEAGRAYEPKAERIFCGYCGDEIPNGKRFCPACGNPVFDYEDAEAYTYGRNQRERKKRETVYEGNLHKCPNCGEIVPSFQTICSTCGHEFRDVKSATSVYELTLKLNEISNRELPDYPEERSSLLKSLFGKDFNDDTTYNQILNRFEEQKIKDKAQLIRNFPVPNTAEDILEFLSLIKSNVNDKDLIDAWEGKLEQVYEKARLSMGEDSRFYEVYQSRLEIKKMIRKKKFSLELCVLILIILLLMIYFVVLGNL